MTNVKRSVKRKLLSAGLAVGCALGAVGLRYAWATPGKTISTTILAGPMTMGEVDIHTGNGDDDGHSVRVKTKGVSDVYLVHNRIAPGGHTGWHSHPGPSFISVVAGTATAYEDDHPGGHEFEAGTTFVDSGEHRHIIVNEGDVDLELIAFQILPEGAPRRTDEPAPQP